ncbi:MAG: lipid A biosynthesis lauroyl acyltransferase [Gammaproteobacteria bacterium]
MHPLSQKIHLSLLRQVARRSGIRSDRAGALLGLWLALRHPYRRAIIEHNIRLCFPDWSARQRRRFVNANLRATGRMFMEMALAFEAPSEMIRPLGRIQGLEHLEHALAAGNGALLLAPHMTCYDMAVRILNEHLGRKVFMLFRDGDGPVMGPFLRDGRESHCERGIGKKDLSGLYTALRENRAVWYAPDQDFSYHHTFAPFFGVQASWVTATHRIAGGSGAAVVPFYYYREERDEGDHGYVLELHPPLKDFPGDDAERDTHRVARWFDEQVRRHPDQYLWAHRRFKTRPPGEPPLY